MILFVSGRCDIPAFYTPWFFHRLKEGYVDVRNPYDPHQISRIFLDEKNIDAILFCTKNPLPMLSRLDEIPFPYLFHITLTAYHKDIERHVPDKTKIIEGIKKLSEKIGKDKVIVRYDPILLSEHYTIAYHIKAFEKLCSELQGYIDHVIISFVDMYKNTKKHADVMKLKEIKLDDMHTLGKHLGKIGKRYHIPVKTCAEEVDLSAYGIEKGLCIDKEKMEKLVGYRLRDGKGVRKECGCMETVDIGDYNCCGHECLYCYANYNDKTITQRIKLHDPYSSVLIGHIEDTDRITIRKDKKIHQLKLL